MDNCDVNLSQTGISLTLKMKLDMIPDARNRKNRMPDIFWYILKFEPSTSSVENE